MDIAFAFDEHYASYVQVPIESILKHHPDDRDITFWVMTTNEGWDLIREPLRRQIKGRASVGMLNSGESFRRLPMSRHQRLQGISPGMYIRLLMAAAVSRQAERLLYLDVDVLCMGSLTELWETNLGGMPLGAVRDGGSPTVGSKDGLPGAPDFIKPDDPYFNSGVLLIDVQEWLHSQITEKSFQYILGIRDELRYPDQDALNVAAHRRWFALDGKWNYMVNYDGDRRHAREDTGIVHFAGRQKPWHEDYPLTGLRSQYISLIETTAGTLGTNRLDQKELIGI
jgi:lipopolysaccharide biosynthesis glycosyltransferase